MKKIVRIPFFIVLLLALQKANALDLPAFFADNMVLQRDKPILIWGKDQPGTTITITLAGNKTTATTGSDSNWKAQLPPMKAGGPYEIKITNTSGSEKTIHNILVGDVWIASGQSNMEFELIKSKNGAEAVKDAANNNIRFLMVPHDLGYTPLYNIRQAAWKIADSTTVPNFSAVAYYFAQKIQATENVPIGIIETTWGGTPAEAWTSREKLETVPEMKPLLEKNRMVNQDSLSLDISNEKQFRDVLNNSYKALDKNVLATDYNDNSWTKHDFPSGTNDWKDIPQRKVVWLRKKLTLPTGFAGKALKINLVHPDIMYTLYLNGKEVVHNAWNSQKSHTYTLPAGMAKEGINQITLRLVFVWEGGGLNSPADSLYITDGQTKVSLAGTWLYHADFEAAFPVVKDYQREQTYLYNAMLHPLIPMGIKGIIWYQGEQNAPEAYLYRTLFPLMINDWRQHWGNDSLPFLFVQLASFMPPLPMPAESEWAELREAQSMALALPCTGMATATDLGDPKDIHPTNKKDVGLRLALAAEKTVYHKSLVASGPVYKKAVVKGNTVTISFSETGTGLVTRGKALKGFAVAGADGKFYWANATITGNTVALSAAEVPAPRYVRYNWADCPEGNLYNKEGLPATPFRTDSFRGITQKQQP